MRRDDRVRWDDRVRRDADDAGEAVVVAVEGASTRRCVVSTLSLCGRC